MNMMVSILYTVLDDYINIIIYHGNRTEQSPIRSVIIQVINKIG